MTVAFNTAPVISPTRSGFLLSADLSGVHAAAVAADGKLIAVRDDAIYRYLPDGSLDRSFGHDGMQTLQTSEPGALRSTQQSFDVSLTSNGQILVVGKAFGTDASSKGNASLAITRVNADGSLDAHFGKNGTVLLNAGASSGNLATGIVELANGKVLVAGVMTTLDANGNTIFGANNAVLVRLLPNGAVDTHFGVAGLVIDPEPDFFPTQILVQPDGKIVCLGDRSSPRAFGVMRFNADGTRDTSFDHDGFATYVFAAANGNASSMALQPDGKLVVVGSSAFPSAEQAISVMRIGVDGSVDTSFGSGGYVHKQVTPDTGTPLYDGGFSHSFSGGNEVHVRADGTILVVGSGHYLDSRSGWVDETLMLSLRADGSLDTSFGIDGGAAIAPRVAGASFLALGATVAADGSTAVFGWDTAPGPGTAKVGSGAILRIVPDGAPDHRFGDAVAASAVSVVRERAPAQILWPELTVSDAQLGAGNYAGASLTLSRAGGANALDVFSGAGALKLADGAASIDGVVIGSVDNGAGTLVIHFGSGATQALLNAALRAIAYQYAGPGDGPVQLVLSFSDGNSGQQGSGGSLSSQLLTNVSWQHRDGLPWIDDMLSLPPGAAQSSFIAAQRALLGGQQGINVQFAPGFSAADQLLANEAVARLLAVAGLRLDPHGTPIVFHPYALGDDLLATSPLSGAGGHLYYSRGADSAEAAIATLVRGLERVFGLAHADLPGDIETAALQALYGPSPSARAGSDVYQLDPNHANFIWDGGGTDTISAAGLSRGVTLHLEAGQWDYIGARGATITANGQITINAGSQIENALGGSGDDTFYGNALANVIDGGAGTDTMVFDKAHTAYAVKASGADWLVGDDTMRSIEQLRFADGYFSFDIVGNAGQVYRVYEAVFGRIPDADGQGFWMAQMDKGLSLAGVAAYFIASPEFAQRFGGSVSNEAFITNLYANVLHRAPDSEGMAFWKGLLDAGAITQAGALTGFSQSPENIAQLVGTMQAGMAYVPVHT